VPFDAIAFGEAIPAAPASCQEKPMDLDFLTDQILARCDELGRLSEVPGGLTRTFLKPPMHKVHASLSQWMLEAGLQVRVDAIGNLIGRQAAKRDRATVFIVGSHVDTVPDAGRYDGVLGVLLGIATAHALADASLHTHLDITAFSEEEGVRFRTPYLGSMALCGTFDQGLLSLKDADGITLAQAVADFGLDPDAIPAAAYPPGSLAGYLEAHIEQGPVLESLDLALGVVRAIVGQSRRRLTFTGRAGHAGTSPMDNRRDALAGAAEFILAIEKLALNSADLRATVGTIGVKPGAANVIAGEACLTLDLRHANDCEREAALAKALQLGQDIAKARKLTCAIESIVDQPAAPCDTLLTSKLCQALSSAGYLPYRMNSGAGHDAAVMARHCPTTMLFLRSPGGLSHHPDECVRREDVRAALDVMICFLQREIVGEEKEN
jgi:allantoate deiminase